MPDKYRCYRLDYGDGYPMGHESWELQTSLKAALQNFGGVHGSIADWEYIQIVPVASYRNYWCGNDGTQAWRHKKTGYAIPDYCRQTGGCPEIWHRSRRRQLSLHPDSPVFEYIMEW